MGYQYKLNKKAYEVYRSPCKENNFSPLCKDDAELMRELSRGLRCPVVSIIVR